MVMSPFTVDTASIADLFGITYVAMFSSKSPYFAERMKMPSGFRLLAYRKLPINKGLTYKSLAFALRGAFLLLHEIRINFFTVQSLSCSVGYGRKTPNPPLYDQTP